jgi:glycosyltransferase involved in cell wall biosynthesis
MKLVIQIPCYNEEKILPKVLKSIPQKIDGINEIIILVINDGSTDRTEQIAQQNGIDVIISNHANIGLAKSFSRGIDKALSIGADIIVNTDGDNQYKSEDIPRLIEFIVKQKADIVIGNRTPEKVEHFSSKKRVLQRFGNIIISKLAGISIPDAVSGFRAYSRDAALRLSVHSNFSYTVETLLNSALQGLTIKFIDIETNITNRPSRLSSGIFDFIFKQGVTILRTFIINKPFFIFGILALILGIPGLIICLSFLYHFFNGNGEGHIQSLVLAAILIICSFISFLFAGITNLISNNRKILEEQLYLTRKQYYKNSSLNKITK